jgi:hypothetical protein
MLFSFKAVWHTKASYTDAAHSAEGSVDPLTTATIEFTWLITILGAYCYFFL